MAEANTLLYDLADWWASAASLTLGSDLYIGDLPEDAATAAMIRATGGPSRGHSHAVEATFQVLVRAADLPDAMALAMTLYDAIYPTPGRQPRRNVTLSDDWRATSIDAIQPPQDLGVGEDGRRKISFNVQVRAHRRDGA